MVKTQTIDLSEVLKNKTFNIAATNNSNSQSKLPHSLTMNLRHSQSNLANHRETPIAKL